MATIYTSSDKLDIVYGNDGLPLPVGSYLKYCEGGTTLLKTIYASDGTTEVGNPVDINAYGRPDYQVTLGAGQYTVYAHKYVGDGIDFITPENWELDHSWKEQGRPTSAAATVSPVIAETIAELRTLDSTDASVVTLAGYYARGDKPAITYTWDSTSMAADDLGYTIRNPLIAVGCWVHKPATQVDVRDYGLKPNSTGIPFYASATAAIAYAASYKLALYFAPGIYEASTGTMTLSVHTIMDKASFKCTGGALNIYFNSTFDIRGTESLQNAAAAYPTYLHFNNSEDVTPVDLRWCHFRQDGATDDGYRFKLSLDATAPYILPNYPVIFTGVTWMTDLTANVTVPHKIIYRESGKLKMQQGTYTCTFAYPGSMLNETEGAGGFRSEILHYSNVSKYRFTQGYKMYSSWFGTSGSVNIAPYLSDWNPYVGQGMQFVLDAPNAWFETSVATNANWLSNFVLVYQGGHIVLTGSGNFHIPNMPDVNAQIISCSTPRVVCGKGRVRVSNFYDLSDVDLATRSAIHCAITGGCDLDLEGNAWSMSTGVTTSISTNPITVYRGSLTMGASITAMYLTGGSSTALTFRDVTFLTGSTTATVLGIGGASMRNIKFDNCRVYGTDTTNSALIRWTGGAIGDVTVTGTEATCKWLFYSELGNTTYATGTLNVFNNRGFICDLRWWGALARISNNEIAGSSTGYWTINSSTPSIISNNRFYQCDLFCEGYGTTNPVIKHIVTGNTFESTVTKWSRVVYSALYAGTRLYGATSTGNNFLSSVYVGDSHPLLTSGAGTFATTYNQANISNNSYQHIMGAASYFVDSATEDILSMTIAEANIPAADVNEVVYVYLDAPTTMFSPAPQFSGQFLANSSMDTGYNYKYELIGMDTYWNGSATKLKVILRKVFNDAVLGGDFPFTFTYRICR